MLVNALENSVPHGGVWIACQALGITLDKLRKDWKKKSLFFLGKAELGRRNPQQAEEYLEAALQLIGDDRQLATGIKEVRVRMNEEKNFHHDFFFLIKLKGLLNKAKQLKAIEIKREKSTWGKVATISSKSTFLHLSLLGFPKE